MSQEVADDLEEFLGNRVRLQPRKGTGVQQHDEPRAIEQPELARPIVGQVR